MRVKSQVKTRHQHQTAITYSCTESGDYGFFIIVRPGSGRSGPVWGGGDKKTRGRLLIKFWKQIRKSRVEMNSSTMNLWLDFDNIKGFSFIYVLCKNAGPPSSLPVHRCIEWNRTFPPVLLCQGCTKRTTCSVEFLLSFLTSVSYFIIRAINAMLDGCCRVVRRFFLDLGKVLRVNGLGLRVFRRHFIYTLCAM